MSRINSRGFGAVEGLLILAIVTMLGFTGWYLLHNKNTTSTPTPTPAPAAPDISPAPTTPAQKSVAYLEIKQLDIKIPTAELNLCRAFDAPAWLQIHTDA